MMRQSTKATRRGTVLPLVVLGLVGLFGFVALAIDLGMVALARTQCQNAADAAAMAGARTLDGNTSTANNAAAAVLNTVTAATDNSVLSTPIDASQVSVQVGTYSYNPVKQSFPAAPYPNLVTVAAGSSPGANPTDNWSLVQAAINYQGQYYFAKVFGMSVFNISTLATAVHQPRDISIILDFSGSMRFASLLGLPYYGTRDLTGNGNPQNPGSNNPETGYPLFGAYSGQAAAGLQNIKDISIAGHQYAAANVTTTTNDARPPVVLDFQLDANGTPAFQPVTGDGKENYAQSSPGDKYLFLNGQTSGGAYASTVTDIVGGATANANWETQGYRFYTKQAVNSYTQGPNYWGKTFFIWPPDPTLDWRRIYFGTTDNTHLWDGQGNWRDPARGNYTINYAAILNWIKNVGPNPFPNQLRSGRIIYYTQIPNTIDTSTFPPADLNQRFWKDYIDYVLGLIQQDAGNWETVTGFDSYRYDSPLGLTGYGGDFAWGKVQITPPPGKGQYMDYRDNPRRPRLHFWFGPMTMVDFLGNYNLWYEVNPAASRYCWWPGTCHEAPLYACKLGIQAALGDINNNHPNDYVSLAMYSVPKGGPNDFGNRFNRVRAPLGRDYPRMMDSLWYPLSTIENPGTTITPYDYNNNIEVPRAMGGTCFAMPLMLAYNQFSANPALQTYNSSPAPVGDAGGLGRKGAQKIIILETDGLPNTTADAALANNGPYNSFYRVRYNSSAPGGSEYPSTGGFGDNDPRVTNQIFNICQTICAMDSASPPGYSTTKKPVLIHCIGFGPVYDVGAPERAGALATLQQIQYIGKTQASPSDPMDLMQPYKIINGTQSQIVNALQIAFTNIMQGGVQVSLVQ